MKQIPQWLENAIFYQIYPPSFYDSNDDGIGDIKGIIEKLDYIRWLGCNAIWLSPCFKSPFRDGGYDVTDYYRVAPRYGTNHDLVDLFKKAERHGIKVILDLVPCHTSIDHPWFKESCKPTKNKYSDWYIWSNNAFGDDARPKMIRGYADKGNYLASYFWTQPALNYGYAHPEESWQQPVNAPGPQAVKKELKKIIRFWLDKGASGFRVDMAGWLIKNDSDCTAHMAFWKDIRQMIDKDYPDAVLISEWGDSITALKCGFHADLLLPHSDNSILRNFIGNRFLFDCSKDAYYGALDGQKQSNLETAVKHYEKVSTVTKNDGFICPTSSSHDVARIVDGRCRDSVNLIYTWLMTVRGIPFIYYGDEIGMKFRLLNSKEGGYQRTGCRTPMQWNNDQNSGFSKADKNNLYLPTESSKTSSTVTNQTNSTRSLLQFVRKLAAIKTENIALSASGQMTTLFCRNNKGLVYLRQKKNNQIIVALNPYPIHTKIEFHMPQNWQTFDVLLGRETFSTHKTKMTFQMNPKSFCIIKVSE